MIFNAVLYAALFSAGYARLIDLKTDPASGQSLLKTSYDYIIVGGGTTGLTVAKRLAEIPSNKVLVLEAGGSGVGLDLVTIPENSFHFIATDIDWFFSTVPQAHASQLEINLSQGKILGGDSAVNGLVWVRGAKEEYDALEQLGSSGWNWDSLYKYMKKSEKLNIPSQDLVKEFGFVVQPSSHGSSGPVDVSFPKFLPLQHQKLIDAVVELGHPFNGDPYKGKNTGVAYSLSSQTKQAVRETSEFAYLTPNVNATNLVVMAFATVSKINLTNKKGKVSASGAQIVFPDGKEYTASVKSSGEVILSAGVVRTPQLLELSGIGDQSILKPLGIDVKVDLPGVGANYEDHTITILTYQLKNGFLSFDALGYNATLLAEQEKLYQMGQGWLTFAQGVVDFEPAQQILNSSELDEAKSLLETKPPSISQDIFDVVKQQVLDGTPQVEFLLFNSFSGGDVKLPNTSYISLAVTHVHPLSRGTIHINTTNINDKPLINPNVLESEWDKYFLAKATAYGRKIMQTDAFQEIVAGEVFPGSSTQTDQDWVDFITRTINLGYHSVGTASLLPKSKNGVVDPNLVVYGTSNLRVADLSILPTLFSSHTQSVAYAVGEKAADIIKGNY